MKLLYYLPGWFCVFYGCFVMAFATRGVSFTPIVVLIIGFVLIIAAKLGRINCTGKEQSRLWRLRLISSLLSCLIAFLASEIVAEVILRGQDQTNLRIFQFDPEATVYGIGVKTGFQQRWTSQEFSVDIRLNNIGLREDEDYHGEKIDIGFYGDSFTFGHGVNFGERYSDQLHTHFPEKRIVSFAYANGWTTPHYYLFMKKHSELLPDIGIIGLFLGNDLTCDIDESDLALDESGELVALQSKMRRVDPRGFLVNRDIDPCAKVASRFWTGELMLRTLHRFGVHRPHRKGANANPPLSLDRGELGESAHVALHYVKKMNDHFRSHNKRLILFIIPWSYYVNGYPTYHSPQIASEIRREQALPKRIVSWCESNNVEVINPIAQFRKQEQNGKRLYFQHDAHWNATGHRAAATVIADYLNDAIKKG